METVNVLKTGSKGNAIILKNIILLDCGVPFSTIKPYIYDLQLVLISHRSFRPFQ